MEVLDLQNNKYISDSLDKHGYIDYDICGADCVAGCDLHFRGFPSVGADHSKMIRNAIKYCLQR